MMFRIQTLDRIAPKGLGRLPSELYRVSEDEAEPHAILVRSRRMHELPLCGSLLAIGWAGSGVDNIPVEACSRAGIAVFSSPGVARNDSVSES